MQDDDMSPNPRDSTSQRATSESKRQSYFREVPNRQTYWYNKTGHPQNMD